MTTHAAIEGAAFALFEEQGFDATTMEDVATAVGVSRRTMFRYYPSKNDILWGQFDQGLDRFAETLASYPESMSISEAITAAIVDFNSFDGAAMPQHRQRMRLLLQTPALLAHSELRYAAWRGCIADFVAHRTGQGPTDPAPALAGRLALSVALTAYEEWLRHTTLDLPDVIRRVSALLPLLIGSWTTNPTLR